MIRRIIINKLNINIIKVINNMKRKYYFYYYYNLIKREKL